MQSFSELLFHTPWWFPVLIIAVGGFVFISGNRRQEPKTRSAGLIIVLLGILVAAVSYFVDTDLEKTVKQSRQMVSAVVSRDWTTAQNLMDRSCSVTVLNFGTIYTKRDQIISAAKLAMDRYGVKNAHVLRVEAQQTGAIITVSIDVLTEQDATMGRPINSSWQFEWRKGAQGWLLTHIDNLKIADQTGSGASAQFPRP